MDLEITNVRLEPKRPDIPTKTVRAGGQNFTLETGKISEPIPLECAKLIIRNNPLDFKIAEGPGTLAVPAGPGTRGVFHDNPRPRKFRYGGVDQVIPNGELVFLPVDIANHYVRSQGYDLVDGKRVQVVHYADERWSEPEKHGLWKLPEEHIHFGQQMIPLCEEVGVNHHKRKYEEIEADLERALWLKPLTIAQVKEIFDGSEHPPKGADH